MQNSYPDVRETCVNSIKSVLGDSSSVIDDALELNQMDLDSLDIQEVLVKLEEYYDINLPTSSVPCTLDQLVRSVLNELNTTSV